ncbi:MAG: hypothetical protein R2828_12670 [Saprospiraceae bacterium]
MINRLALVVITLFFIGGSSITAQNAETKAKAMLQQLKNGALIIRIPSNQNKIKALTELTNKAEATVVERERAASLLESTQNETAAESVIIQATFANFFKFTQCYFMYDKDTDQLSKGEKQGYFLDEQLQYSSTVTLDVDHFFVLDIGYTDPANSARSYALIIKDQGFKELTAPFPYAQRINTTGLIIDQLSGKNNFQKYFKKAVIKLDKRLERALAR